MRHDVKPLPVVDRLDQVYAEAARRGFRVLALHVSVREWHTLTGGVVPPTGDLLAFRGVPLRIRPSEA